MEKREYRDRFNNIIDEVFKAQEDILVLQGVAKLLDEAATLAYTSRPGTVDGFVAKIAVDLKNRSDKDSIEYKVYQRFIEEVLQVEYSSNR